MTTIFPTQTMKRRWVILAFLPALMSIMVGWIRPVQSSKRAAPIMRLPQPNDTVRPDSLTDSDIDTLLRKSIETDTTQMDSLHRAIFRHNQIIDDSIRLDSINRARSNGIEAPVKYKANDSLVYMAETKTAHLYGSSDVDYQSTNVKSEKIYLSLDSSMVYATGVADSTAENGLRGKPVVKWGKDEYELDTIRFNFKSKMGLIRNVYTAQEDGFLTSAKAKRDDEGNLYLQHGTYTTCDAEHPDFYIALSRAKVRPGKDVVFGPAYLVVADVPLPLAIPYGFFPFTKSYSSGFIMPTYGDESSRGFYLRDGGYYFAISDKWDLKLLGEIYTKGSWGISAASNYVKRYRYSGSFYFSYLDTRTGDKGMPDYTKTESIKLQWTHNQDAKANPYSKLSARVNFASSSYENNNLTSLYNPQARSQSTRTSAVDWSTTFSSIGMSLSLSTHLTQRVQDSIITLSLPELTMSISQFYPFRRKKAVGEERWYEKISMRYNGRMSNSIETKENKLFKSNLIKDWNNGFSHTIPINASFTLFNYINVSPSFTLNDRMYMMKVERDWDKENQREVRDTTYGFHNVYDWNLSLQLSTKLYGMYIPNKKIFGDKIQAVRHVFSPSVSFSYAPDFSSSHYGYYGTYQKTDADGNVSLVDYGYYQGMLYGMPGTGKTGSVTFDVSNNIEMKIKSDKDSTGIRKISIIDELGASLSYNMAAKVRPWSNLTTRLRLKWWKNYTFNLNATFSTYAYELDENGRPYIGTHTEWGRGRFGRFQGMSQSFNYTITPEKIRKLFGGGDDDDDEELEDDDEGYDTDIEANIDEDMERGRHAAKKKKKSNVAETDADGYMSFNMPWSLTIGYGITMSENTAGKFNTESMRYPYKFTQTLNVSGNIRISDGWNINFSSGYDFERKKLSMTTASLSRDLHCFNMSCSVVLAPYTSYNFSFRCNASTLTDALKYDKRSGYSNAVQWY